jgi:extracellular factor (EF) 3-hydroxypalmitic acid methyl ester biosynthesis protein
MCDPFIHRSYTKPLGYAGDYQVVNMILGGPDHYSSTYARIVSTFNLTRGPAVAHRNRIRRLEELLREEARSKAAQGKRLRVLNIGCGPAVEVERFVAHEEASSGCEIMLVDFNEETLKYAESRIARAREKGRRALSVSTAHQSIHDLLKAAASGESALASEYDFVYCAGLFDYLPDRVCRRLLRLYHQWTAPGGLVVVTNVHAANPVQAYMAHLADWYLEHRDEKQFLSFASNQMVGRVSTDPTGVNIFLEIRKPRN